MALGIFALSVMDALVKLAAEELQTWQIVVLRYAFGGLFALLYFSYQQRGTRFLDNLQNLLSSQIVKTSLLRAFFMVLTASCFYFALSELPLAQAVTIAFSAPLFMVLFSRLLLGEPITGSALLAIGLGFTGVLIIFGDAIFQPLSGTFLPMASALCASIFYSLAIVFSRKHSTHTKPDVMVLMQTCFALILALPFGLLPSAETEWIALTAGNWLLFICIGVLGSAGHVLLIWALARETASRLGPIEYTGLIWAVLLGALIFGDLPDWRTMIGAFFVVIGCVLASRRKPPKPA